MSRSKNIIQLTEEDLKKLFKHHRKKKPDIWDYSWAFFRSLFIFIVLFAVFFILINLPAYYQKMSYFLNTVIFGKEITVKALSSEKQEINRIKIKDSRSVSKTEQINNFLKKYVPENSVVIPSLGIRAPIVWDSPPDKILEDLRQGTAHYKGTAHPGENGNVFITGHSSNYWWDPGKYKQVFALLDKAKIGERIYITYHDQPYVYLIEDSKVVKPDNIEVINPSDHSVVTLMTCTPVGTTINRRIVQARQIYPNPAQTPKVTPPPLNRLPVVR